MIVVLTGGTGGAKFVDGLRQIVPSKDLTIIVNTGDDLEWWGLYVSPDLDSITYVLAGLLSKERGWGVKGDTFFCLQAMGDLGEPIWFHTGDRDLAVHLLRTKLLKQGKTLSEVSAEIAAKMGVEARILPMTQQPCRNPGGHADRRTQLRGIFRAALVSGPGQIDPLCRDRKGRARARRDRCHPVRHRGAARAQQSRHQHRPHPGCPRHCGGPQTDSRPGGRRESDHRQHRSFGTGRHFDGGPGLAGFDRRRGPGLSRISGHSGGRQPRRQGSGRTETVRAASPLRQHDHEHGRRKG